MPCQFDHGEVALADGALNIVKADPHHGISLAARGLRHGNACGEARAVGLGSRRGGRRGWRRWVACRRRRRRLAPTATPSACGAATAAGAASGASSAARWTQLRCRSFLRMHHLAPPGPRAEVDVFARPTPSASVTATWTDKTNRKT